MPVGGGQTGGQEGQSSAGCAPGLECVPLEFEFRGSFFDLADFFHQMKRFVKAANKELEIQGRLLTMDALKFTTDEGSTTALKAEVKATVYLAPKSEGATAGATPQGPSQTVSSDSGQPSTPTPPTAAVTP